MRPLILLRKAKIPGDRTPDLFDAVVPVRGYVKQDGTAVAPHQAVRQKRLPEPPAPDRQNADTGTTPPPPDHLTSDDSTYYPALLTALRARLSSGGNVQITTALRTITYGPAHVDLFRMGDNGGIEVRHGQQWLALGKHGPTIDALARDLGFPTPSARLAWRTQQAATTFPAEPQRHHDAAAALAPLLDAESAAYARWVATNSPADEEALNAAHQALINRAADLGFSAIDVADLRDMRAKATEQPETSPPSTTPAASAPPPPVVEVPPVVVIAPAPPPPPKKKAKPEKEPLPELRHLAVRETDDGIFIPWPGESDSSLVRDAGGQWDRDERAYRFSTRARNKVIDLLRHLQQRTADREAAMAEAPSASGGGITIRPGMVEFQPRITLAFPYAPGAVARIKKVPSAKWAADKKVWHIDPLHWPVLKRQLPVLREALRAEAAKRDTTPRPSSPPVTKPAEVPRTPSGGGEIPMLADQAPVEGYTFFLDNRPVTVTSVSRRYTLDDDVGSFYPHLVGEEGKRAVTVYYRPATAEEAAAAEARRAETQADTERKKAQERALLTFHNLPNVTQSASPLVPPGAELLTPAHYPYYEDTLWRLPDGGLVFRRYIYDHGVDAWHLPPGPDADAITALFRPPPAS